MQINWCISNWRTNLCVLDCFVPTNDEFCKLVNFSVFEKSIFSSGSRNDGDTYRLCEERSNPEKKKTTI